MENFEDALNKEATSDFMSEMMMDEEEGRNLHVTISKQDFCLQLDAHCTILVVKLI